jgi:hypothetical protein
MNRNDVGVGIGAVLLMSLCCGGPLLLLAGAAIGPAILSAIGVPTIAAVGVGGAVAVGIVLWRRRSCADCTTHPTERETEFGKARLGR